MVKDRAFYRSLLHIALPAAFQSLISLGVVLLNNLMVGGLGETAMSAVSLANQVTVFFTFFIKGVSGGAAIFVSQYWGRKDLDRIRTIFGIIFQVGAAFSVTIAALVFFFPAGVMGIFTDSPEIIAAALPYIRLICFSYVLFTLSDTMVAMLRCVEVVKITLIVSACSLLFGLFFNYALIYGHFGFPALGLRGAAAATLVTRALELVVVAFYLLKVQKTIALRARDLLRGTKQMWRDFLKFGGPIIAGDLQWGLVNMVKAMIIGRLGVQMVAANSIAEMMLSMGLLFTNSLATAACVLIGKTIGEDDYPRTRAYSRTIQILFLCVGIVMAAAVFLGRNLFIGAYNISAQTAALASTLCAVGAATMVGTAYHAASFTGINRGGGDSHFVFKVDMICGWFIMLPLSYLSAFVFRLPLPLVYLATRIDQCFKWLIAFIRLRGDKWIHNVTRKEPPCAAAAETASSCGG